MRSSGKSAATSSTSMGLEYFRRRPAPPGAPQVGIDAAERDEHVGVRVRSLGDLVVGNRGYAHRRRGVDGEHHRNHLAVAVVGGHLLYGRPPAVPDSEVLVGRPLQLGRQRPTAGHGRPLRVGVDVDGDARVEIDGPRRAGHGRQPPSPAPTGAPPGRRTASRSRRAKRRTLPVAVLGSWSTTSTRRGRLNAAIPPRQWASMPAGGATCPARGTRKATVTSSPSASRPPTTAASSTSGCSTRTLSTSAGDTQMPPALIMSLLRPRNVQ